MHVDRFFPVEFFTFRNSDIDNQALISKLEKVRSPIKEGTCLSMTADIHILPEFSELFQWINRCITEMKNYMSYDCDRIDITSSWFNVSMPDRNHYMNYHRHSMSFYSGVYYLTEGASTVFEDPVIHRTQAQIEVLRKDYNPSEYIIPEPGKLVLFPSWVYHMSQTHLGKNSRYIISFNTMPAGKINHNSAADSKANIEIRNNDGQ